MKLSFRDVCVLLWWLMEGRNGPGLHASEAISNIFDDIPPDMVVDAQTFAHLADTTPATSCETIFARAEEIRFRKILHKEHQQ